MSKPSSNLNRNTKRGDRIASSTKVPQVLESKDVKGVAKYLASGKCKNVFFMLGAGLSTSAGIPDFRSPKTGLYANLARLKLPHPEAVFEIDFFRRNPVPFYTLAQELYPGKFRPTISHSFIRLIAEHSLLHTCFTQNIDTLERRAGIPDDKVIEAHGSFAVSRCIECKKVYNDVIMKEKVNLCEVPRCESCNGLVKPDIVFFGEALPPAFIESIPSLFEADLLIIIGTSLTVHPFASLTEMVGKNCPRILINLDKVGTIGSRPNDVILLGQCDETVRDICKEAGWHDELEELWDTTKDSVEGVKKDKKADTAEEEVEKLTEVIGKKLDLGGEGGEKIERKQDQIKPREANFEQPKDNDGSDVQELKNAYEDACDVGRDLDEKSTKEKL